MWRVVSLYRRLFEMGATLEDVIAREHIEIQRKELKEGMRSMQFWGGNHSIFTIDPRLKDTDYRRAVAHELYHYFNPGESEFDPEHPHSYDFNARLFAELYLELRGQAIPTMGRLNLYIGEIEKTLEFR